MKSEYSVRVSSILSADRETVWQHSTDLAQVNREFFPILKMTYPLHAGNLTQETVVLGQRLFRSWILLLGVFPVEYDDIALAAINPGHGFLEQSSMFMQKIWRHKRTITDEGSGCRVTDEIAFVPRLPMAGVIQQPLFSLLFQYRHWRLKRLFR